MERVINTSINEDQAYFKKRLFKGISFITSCLSWLNSFYNLCLHVSAYCFELSINDIRSINTI